VKFGVVIFPGSNCDQDVIHVCKNVLQSEVIELWHKTDTVQNLSPQSDCIILPGGFSYGDYLRSGAIARFSPIMKAVIQFAEQGGLVIGICNGFQILCEAGLLPGALVKNTQQNFICKNVHIKVENSNTPFTQGVDTGRVLKIPIAHSEGRFLCNETTLQQLQQNEQIIFRYCTERGETNNPNGSLNNIAGICNMDRNVIGMMPHPERAAETDLGNTNGLLLFESLFTEVQKA